ncbi:unnamed protein product [Prunus armeniaca]|uniref:Uncharacterized protein n=1 Tax=Prunus armeniaca TaxID=36596 RepID=A0A6J5V9M5_PRUAR|nr:unnamed protein product [Prunus armeniaca]CAB4316142.1 unnamed protein product [Prunus armeniaca]
MFCFIENPLITLNSRRICEGDLQCGKSVGHLQCGLAQGRFQKLAEIDVSALEQRSIGDSPDLGPRGELVGKGEAAGFWC